MATVLSVAWIAAVLICLLLIGWTPPPTELPTEDDVLWLDDQPVEVRRYSDAEIAARFAVIQSRNEPWWWRRP